MMKKNNRIYLRVSEEEKRMLQELSEQNEQTVSEIVRKSVKLTLDELRKEECLNGIRTDARTKPIGYISR